MTETTPTANEPMPCPTALELARDPKAFRQLSAADRGRVHAALSMEAGKLQNEIESFKTANPGYAAFKAQQQKGTDK